MTVNQRALVWIAQGFGVGRIPFGPGTWGSLIGMLWLWVVLIPGSWLGFSVLVVTAALLAVPICQRAEMALGVKDPSSIVLDEIVAVPLAYVVWLGWGPQGWFSRIRSTEECFQSQHLWELLAIFVVFRFFDIVKIGPIHRTQRLPGGWGIVADDIAAAVFTNVLAGLWIWLR